MPSCLNSHVNHRGKGHFVRTKVILLCMIPGPDLEVNDHSMFVLLLLKEISPTVFNEYLCHMNYKLIF